MKVNTGQKTRLQTYFIVTNVKGPVYSQFFFLISSAYKTFAFAIKSLRISGDDKIEPGIEILKNDL